jgi:hypothetical protein
MTGFEALLFGFGLGVGHPMDADHVVIVSTLLSRDPGRRRAAERGPAHSEAPSKNGCPGTLAFRNTLRCPRQ